jgi:hypothetical protein
MIPAVSAASPSRAWGGAGRHTSSRERRMTADETHALVARNSVGCVHYPLADGPTRTIRVRYAREGSALYVPAWTSVEHWYSTVAPAVECDVSEVDWHSCWRYVWLRGPATPLQPTGGAREREAWRQGIAALRRTLTHLAATDELALSNFGIVRLDVESCDGVAVRWGETAALGSLAVTNP